MKLYLLLFAPAGAGSNLFLDTDIIAKQLDYGIVAGNSGKYPLGIGFCDLSKGQVR